MACAARLALGSLAGLVWLAALGALGVTGCASVNPPAAGASGTDAGTITDDFGRSRLIAADFVGALQQVPTLAPQRTRLATRAPDSRFATLLLGALQDAGYELRIGDGSSRGAASLAWRIDAAAPADGSGAWRFSLRVDEVSLERRYRADEHGVVPLSAMAVRLAPVPVALADRRIATVLPPVPPSVATASEAQPGTVSPNLFRSGVSRHAARLSRHAAHRTQVMVFPNDSMLLGDENKRIARAMIADFDPERDLISLIGCSHGATALSDGNRQLALGRAARVKDEFIHAGIAADQVLDEGCWAGQGHASMPPRGVVITHHRRSVTG